MSPERNSENSDHSSEVLMLILEDRYEEALPLAEEAFKRNPSPTHQYNYLFILNRLGRHEEVVAVYSNLDNIGRIMHLKIACESFLELKRYQDVITMIQGKVSRHTFVDPELYPLLAEAYAQTGDHAKAVQMRIQAVERRIELEEDFVDAIRDVIEDRPGDPELHMSLGYSLVELGDYCAAINAYREAIKYISHYDFPELDYEPDEIVDERQRILACCEAGIAECKAKLQNPN